MLGEGVSTLTALKYKMHKYQWNYSSCHCLFDSILIQGVYLLYSTTLISMRGKYSSFMEREGQDKEDKLIYPM